MIKKTEQKKNKKIMLIVKTIIVIVVVVMLWCFYSLVRFDGIYSPIYVWGLSNPYKYYQKHIGSLLVKHGTEYKLKPTIDEQNPKTYNVYRNEEHRFEFKYPKGVDIKIDNTVRSDTSDSLIASSNRDYDVKCEILAIYKGWGVGKNWLPKRRRFNKQNLENSKIIKYFIAKNGQIILIDNDFMKKKNITNAQYGVSVEFFGDNQQEKFVRIHVVGINCGQLIENIFSTFQFIE